MSILTVFLVVLGLVVRKLTRPAPARSFVSPRTNIRESPPTNACAGEHFFLLLDDVSFPGSSPGSDHLRLRLARDAPNTDVLEKRAALSATHREGGAGAGGQTKDAASKSERRYSWRVWRIEATQIREASVWVGSDAEADLLKLR